jgi:perosamine synthetase
VTAARPGQMDSIPITLPVFGEEEMRAVQLPLESGWVVQGPYVAEFEALFTDFVASRYAVATTSCTTAMHIAVAALDLKPSEEVVVPALTWISTANVVEYLGARPVFCDIDLRTFNIDVAALEAVVTPRTAGIIPVHLFGLAAEMEGVLQVSRQSDAWVLEDAACGLGARIDGKHVGTFGDAGCFSFHPRKSITTGEGGMITSNRADLDVASRELRDHGASKSDLARHEGTGAFLLSQYNRLGFNFRMTDIQGALGAAQMARCDAILDARRAAAARYDALIADCDWLRPQAAPEGYDHGYQAYVCLYAPEEPTLANLPKLHRSRNTVMERLERLGIATRQGTHAAALQGYYVEKYGYRREDFPNAAIAEALTLTLPLFPQITVDQQEFVIEELRRAQRSAV